MVTALLRPLYLLLLVRHSDENDASGADRSWNLQGQWSRFESLAHTMCHVHPGTASKAIAQSFFGSNSRGGFENGNTLDRSCRTRKGNAAGREESIARIPQLWPIQSWPTKIKMQSILCSSSIELSLLGLIGLIGRRLRQQPRRADQ